MWLDRHPVDDFLRRRPASRNDFRPTQIDDLQRGVVDVEGHDKHVVAVPRLVHEMAVIQS